MPLTGLGRVRSWILRSEFISKTSLSLRGDGACMKGDEMTDTVDFAGEETANGLTGFGS